jgi:Domain of unknown function (DUF1996)
MDLRGHGGHLRTWITGLVGARRSRRRVVAVATVVVVVSAGVTGAYAAVFHPGSGKDHGSLSPVATPVSTTGFPSGNGQVGIFTDRCAYSHEAPDDAILAYGLPGVSMHHDFFGNTTTDASSTASGLVGGATTCTTSADSSAYWTPVLYQGGRQLHPESALIYWRRPAHDLAPVPSLPVGLQLIAGNEGATVPQGTDVIAWTCTGTDQAKTSTPHDCASGHDVRVVVTFPSCWDGHSLPAAHQLNVVYRTAVGCPASHPVQIPQIIFHVAWPTSSGAQLTLSMSPTMQGSTNTMHVDFINGWNEAIVDRDIAACVAASTRCGPVTGPDAIPHGPKQSANSPGMKRVAATP